MEDHCRWKFHGFPEGNTYSGRLRYIQNCRSVIVTHEPRWLQHWTHLYNADWNSPDQNIVFVPPAIGPGEGVLVHDGDKERRDRTWERLPETMDRLLADDKLAKKIADNQWQFFRERWVSILGREEVELEGFLWYQSVDVRCLTFSLSLFDFLLFLIIFYSSPICPFRYISPASAACYWRKAIRGLAQVSNKISRSFQLMVFREALLLSSFRQSACPSLAFVRETWLANHWNVFHSLTPLLLSLGSEIRRLSKRGRNLLREFHASWNESSWNRSSSTRRDYIEIQARLDLEFRDKFRERIDPVRFCFQLLLFLVFSLFGFCFL